MGHLEVKRKFWLAQYNKNVGVCAVARLKDVGLFGGSAYEEVFMNFVCSYLSQIFLWCKRSVFV